jgi:hypothetical protein
MQIKTRTVLGVHTLQGYSHPQYSSTIRTSPELTTTHKGTWYFHPQLHYNSVHITHSLPVVGIKWKLLTGEPALEPQTSIYFVSDASTVTPCCVYENNKTKREPFDQFLSTANGVFFFGNLNLPSPETHAAYSCEANMQILYKCTA